MTLPTSWNTGYCLHLGDSPLYHPSICSMTWIAPKTVSGTPPMARNAQTVVAVGTKLVLFGGHSGSKHLRDTHVFDSEKLEWSQPEVRGAAPPGLRGHTANLFSNDKIIGA